MRQNKIPIIAIIGRANVGKSSLFNAVLKRREAIVAREAGTTRDSVSAISEYNGKSFWIVDTAGMKDAEDEFELTIQEQIASSIDVADILWVVVEKSTTITDEDRNVAKLALKSKKPVFLVVNKSDIAKGDKYQFEKLGIKNIFFTAATQNRGIDKLLKTTTDNLPKIRAERHSNKLVIALVGRPNVGKSYLFNTLSKKQQAIVSSNAGTTRDINRVDITYHGRTIEFLDTAGIRRSGKIKLGVERFSVIRTLYAIEQSDVCILLMDSGELNVQLDQKIAGMVKESGKGLILAVSKWDIYKDKDPYSSDKIAKNIAFNFSFVPWAPLVFTSALTGQNVLKLIDLAIDIDKNRHKKILTRSLNKWLKETTMYHPPAGTKNYTPKLNYITQEKDNEVPSFKIFASSTRNIHWSYKRYLENSLRDNYNFDGTPLQLWFIEKHATHKHGVSPTMENR